MKLKGYSMSSGKEREKLAEIRAIYSEIKPLIIKRLYEFKNLWENGKEEDIFAELVFCLLTPQSKAKLCWNAVCELKNKNLLIKGSPCQISKNLKGVRFQNNKAKYIVHARKIFFKDGKIKIKEVLENFKDVFEKREFLVKNVKGMGYKEASHFLRNIGFYEDIAILDRHILKNLKNFGIIDKIPVGLSGKKYLEIEDKMRKFSKRIKIPLSHLDFILWYKETKEIFK